MRSLFPSTNPKVLEATLAHCDWDVNTAACELLSKDVSAAAATAAAPPPADPGVEMLRGLFPNASAEELGAALEQSGWNVDEAANRLLNGGYTTR